MLHFDSSHPNVSRGARDTTPHSPCFSKSSWFAKSSNSMLTLKFGSFLSSWPMKLRLFFRIPYGENIRSKTNLKKLLSTHEHKKSTYVILYSCIFLIFLAEMSFSIFHFVHPTLHIYSIWKVQAFYDSVRCLLDFNTGSYR